MSRHKIIFFTFQNPCVCSHILDVVELENRIGLAAESLVHNTYLYLYRRNHLCFHICILTKLPSFYFRSNFKPLH